MTLPCLNIRTVIYKARMLDSLGHPKGSMHISFIFIVTEVKSHSITYDLSVFLPLINTLSAHSEQSPEGRQYPQMKKDQLNSVPKGVDIPV